MINCLRIFARKRIPFFASSLFNISPSKLLIRTYSSSKSPDDQAIKITPSQIHKIRQILAKGQNILQSPQQQGQNVFQSKQAKLSLQLIQIDTLEQLKPIIKTYSTEVIPKQIDESVKQLIRCKFIILFKYDSLQGSLLSDQIQELYKDIIDNLQHFTQSQLTVFLRMIAHNRQVQISFKKRSKGLILINNPSHTNSQLLSLLLMIYPQQKDTIYKHYFLHSTKKEENYRQGIEQKPKEMIYDPINLMHILSHYYYYEDVQQLMQYTMKTKSIQEKDCFSDQSISTDQDLAIRKVEAVILAIEKQLQPLFIKYLHKNYIDLNKLHAKQAISLLKSITSIGKVQPQNIEVLIQSTNLLITNILSRSDYSADEEHELQQSANYTAIGQVITNYIRKKHSFIEFNAIIDLIVNAFGYNSPWIVNFGLYSLRDLFPLIVAYKASKDLLKGESKQLDSQNKVFVKMLKSYTQLINSQKNIDNKQLFYVCLFAYQLQCLEHLKSKEVVARLQIFEQGQISAVARQNLTAIIRMLTHQ